jgi:hypothetical protein
MQRIRVRQLVFWGVLQFFMFGRLRELVFDLLRYYLYSKLPRQLFVEDLLFVMQHLLLWSMHQFLFKLLHRINVCG